MTTIFVYGTLKKGHYNHTRFKEEGLGKFVDNDSVLNMALIKTNPYYPTAIDYKNFHIDGELWEIEDPNLLTTLRQMEKSAGYKEKEITTLKNKKGLIWYRDDIPSPNPRDLFNYFPLPYKTN